VCLPVNTLLDVFLTVDVEIWPDDWDLDKGRFRRYFERYILGGPSGHGLPFQLRLLEEYGLKANFFVEPLFAWEYGHEPLAEIVSLIRGGGQEVQLHLHTEWVGKSTHPILPGRSGLHLRDYPEDEQARLIGMGLEYLRACGANEICAFRAGNFGANRDTLRALVHNGIPIDSSYNRGCRVSPMLDDVITRPTLIGGVREYPVTVYRAWPGRLRHAQIGASGYYELAGVLRQAVQDSNPVVVFWHSAELLNAGRTRGDALAVRRFEKFCRMLAAQRGQLRTRWFSETMQDPAVPGDAEAPVVEARFGATLMRHGAQALRRVLYR
jgi:hypothetical protein